MHGPQRGDSYLLCLTQGQGQDPEKGGVLWEAMGQKESWDQPGGSCLGVLWLSLKGPLSP